MTATEAAELLKLAPTYGWSAEMTEAFHMARGFLASNAEDLDAELEDE